MTRRLMALRIELTPPPGKPVEVEFIAGIGDPAKYIHQPPAGKKWADVEAGDVLTGDARRPWSGCASSGHMARTTATRS